MFLILKRKWILLFLCLLFVVASVVVYFSAIRPTSMPKPERCIVVDAGHGGIDNGASGKTTGVLESELNLAYAQTLQSLFEEFGFRVVMTRSNPEGLYALTAANKKKSDMQKRKTIIDQAQADVVISVHMNSFPLSSCQGAQVYYAIDNEEGQRLAQSVQSSIAQGFSSARKTATVGDFYILNCTQKPAILVEFGFLSNPEEEQKLQQEEYRKQICLNVVGGVLLFL